jgi:hypothetical protein
MRSLEKGFKRYDQRTLERDRRYKMKKFFIFLTMFFVVSSTVFAQSNLGRFPNSRWERHGTITSWRTLSGETTSTHNILTFHSDGTWSEQVIGQNAPPPRIFANPRSTRGRYSVQGNQVTFTSHDGRTTTGTVEGNTLRILHLGFQGGPGYSIFTFTGRVESF